MASGGAPPPSLVVHNIPEGIDDETLDLFFSSKRNGGAGDVEGVTFPLDSHHPQSARLVFSAANTVLRICSAERVMKRNRLRLKPENIEESVSRQILITPVDSCPKHAQQPVDYVCSEVACVGKLFCIHCVHDEHKDHAWTLLEYEVREKRAEVDKVVLPDLRTGVDALKTGVDTLKAKLKEADRSFQEELKILKNDEKINLDTLKAEYDANQKKLDDDFNKQKKKMTQEVKKVSAAIAVKWGEKQKELRGSEKKCSKHLKDMRSELAWVERTRSDSDWRAMYTAISRAKKCSEESEGLKPLYQSSAALPATTFNLRQFAALALVVSLKPKAETKRQGLTSEVFEDVTCVVNPANVAEVLSAAATVGDDFTAQMSAGRTMFSGTIKTLESLQRDLGECTISTGQSNLQVSLQLAPVALRVYDVPDGVGKKFLKSFFERKKNGGNGNVEDVIFPLDSSHPTSARIMFGDSATIDEICTQPRVIRGRTLRTEKEMPLFLDTTCVVNPRRLQEVTASWWYRYKNITSSEVDDKTVLRGSLLDLWGLCEDVH